MSGLTPGQPCSLSSSWRFLVGWVSPAREEDRGGIAAYLGICISKLLISPGDAGIELMAAVGPSRCPTGTSVHPGRPKNNMFVTAQRATPPGPYNYNCRFAGIDGTNLDIYREDELTDCVETLEAYGITTADDYPAGGAMTAMTGIQVQVGGSDATLDWQMVDAVTDCGEHADLVSNSSPGGEIDLYY